MGVSSKDVQLGGDSFKMCVRCRDEGASLYRYFDLYVYIFISDIFQYVHRDIVFVYIYTFVFIYVYICTEQLNHREQDVFTSS